LHAGTHDRNDVLGGARLLLREQQLQRFLRQRRSGKAPHRGERLVPCNRISPRDKVGVRVELRGLAGDDQESVLDDVLREGKVAHNAQDIPVQTRLIFKEELLDILNAVGFRVVHNTVVTLLYPELLAVNLMLPS
jgi:hypothetical protein